MLPILAPHDELTAMNHAPSKSTVRRWFDKLVHGRETTHGQNKAIAMTQVATRGVRQLGEAGITGVALGGAKAILKGGLDPVIMGHQVPLDGMVAGVGAVAALALAGEEGAVDALNVSAAGMAIFACRKTDALVAAKHAGIHGESPSGADIGREDPIVAAARKL